MSVDKYDDLDDILKKYLEPEDFEESYKSNVREETSERTLKTTPNRQAQSDTRKRSSGQKSNPTKSSNVNKPNKPKNSKKAVKKKKKFKKYMSATIISLLCVSGVFFALSFRMQTKVTLEVGQELDIKDIVKLGSDKANFVTEEDLALLKSIGSHIIQVSKNNKIYDITIEVVDTTKPKAEGMTLLLSKALDIKPEQCVTDVVDATNITYSFNNSIDMTSEKEQKVVIILEDEGGNTTKVTSYITLSNDVTAPVLEGADSFESPLNEGVSYKKLITATDDSGEEVTLDIDNSSVDVTTEGDYTVIYTATDHVGNVTVKEVVITIYKKSQSQELVEKQAETIIAEITKDSMSDEEKATAIFYWVRENVAFTNSTIRNSWVDGAYAGLFNKAGDCYVYAMTTKVLLDTANIVNMDIEKIPSSTEHFWNLVDVGNGWIHLDTTRRKDGTLICLWNDSKLITYSNANSKSHNYDSSEYPTIN